MELLPPPAPRRRAVRPPPRAPALGVILVHAPASVRPTISGSASGWERGALVMGTRRTRHMASMDPFCPSNGAAPVAVLGGEHSGERGDRAERAERGDRPVC